MNGWVYFNHMDIEYGYILSINAEYKMITFMNKPNIST
jgi:hypothetical protein